MQFSGCASSGVSKGLTPEQQQAKKDSILQKQKIELYKLWSTGYEADKQKNFPKAVRYYRQVVEKDTIDVYGSIKYQRLGNALLQTQSTDSAEWAFKKGIALDPEKPYYYRTLGYIYRASGRHDEAVTMYIKLTELEADKAENFDLLADSYVALDDMPNAIQALQKELELQPNNKSAQEKLTGLLNASGDINEIIAAQIKMIELEPENIKYRMDLAKTYHNDAQFEAASKALNIVIAKEPENLYALELLGDCYKQLEHFNDAATTYKRILELNTNDKKNMCNLADCYTSLGRYTAALRQARKAKGNNFGQAWLSIGFVYQTAAEQRVNERGGEIKFDDKLVYEFAYKAFLQAKKDLSVKREAERFVSFLKELIPTSQDRFMHDYTLPKDEAYKWVQ